MGRLGPLVAARENDRQDTNDGHRERQQLAHREPVEGDEPQMDVGLAEKFGDESQRPVADEESPRHHPDGSRLGRHQPDQAEQNQAFRERLIER